MGSLWQDLTAGYVMEKTYLRGLGVALVTPMKSDGGVDSVSAKRLLEYVIGGGVVFLLVLGTSGDIYFDFTGVFAFLLIIFFCFCLQPLCYIIIIFFFINRFLFSAILIFFNYINIFF